MKIPTLHERKLSWTTIGFVVFTSVVSIIAGPWYFFSYQDKSLPLLIFAGIYFILSGLSISAGYHRYFCHRSYTASPLLRWFFILVGASVWQGSLATWMSDHRLHHQDQEGDTDPYPIKYGFAWAYLGWLFWRKYPSIPADIQVQKDIMWQHRNYKIVSFLGSFGLGLLAGLMLGRWWEGLLLIGFIRTTYWHHVTFLINSWGHSHGYTLNNNGHTYAKNDYLLALITFGEGFHNNHHNRPQYFSTQMKPGEFDFTKYFILMCEKFKLAKGLKKYDISKKISS